MAQVILWSSELHVVPVVPVVRDAESGGKRVVSITSEPFSPLSTLRRKGTPLPSTQVRAASLISF